MADTSTASTTPTDQSGPLDAGHTTSEFAITKIVVYMGIAAMAIGFATDVLTALQVLVPAWAWIGTALMIAGKATALLKALGYDATRKAIKVAAQQKASNTTVLLPPATAAAELGAVS
jgi:hypothetical protein